MRSTLWYVNNSSWSKTSLLGSGAFTKKKNVITDGVKIYKCSFKVFQNYLYTAIVFSKNFSI